MRAEPERRCRTVRSSGSLTDGQGGAADQHVSSREINGDRGTPCWGYRAVDLDDLVETLVRLVGDSS